ncbi:hypothetical protein AWZ03_010923 [Drosophila navojoa]|uniref:Uncharacterized protein n=1 Tax=Drosophila navojoa TaxID=7232 RepID=A0A484B1J1_DRONA|nr:uncharacterized protein LOC115563949 [Drosophila navojoa]TDG42656.1 hypothetical protein AWZ03_010923 [Drosophila navojoa]
MIKTEDEQITDNKTDKAETTVALVTSKVKVLSIGDQEEYLKPEKPKETEFDKQIFYDECRRHFGQLLLGSRTPFVSNNWFVMDLFEVKTIEEDDEPRRYQFECNIGGSPGKYVERGVFGQTLYADEVMHELRNRLKDKKWISKNTLVLPKKTDLTRSTYRFADEYYIHNMIVDIIQGQRFKIFKFLLYLHQEYANERHKHRS